MQIKHKITRIYSLQLRIRYAKQYKLFTSIKYIIVSQNN